MKHLIKKITAAALLAAVLFTSVNISAYARTAETNAKTAEGETTSAEATTGGAIAVTPAAITVKKTSIKSVIPGKTSVMLKLTSSGKGKITGFQVYKKNSDSDWVLKTQIRKSKAFYEDTKVSYGNSYSYRARAYYVDEDGNTHYGAYSKTVTVKVTIHQEKIKVKDKKSILYGKTIILYKYGNGKVVTDPTKYVKIKPDKYVLYVNKSKDYVTAYAVSGKNLIPVKSFICSPGAATPVGRHKTLTKYRWHELMGPCWGQWCTKVTKDGIYFHSIFSSKRNSNSTMSVRAYNKLGTTCSHGCIRVQAASAKWIYDNCKVGTSVVIYTKNGYEPFSKPSIKKIPSWHTWDPTDPTAQKLCKKHKCHKYSKK